jgi:hypothetical protein
MHRRSPPNTVVLVRATGRPIARLKDAASERWLFGFQNLTGPAKILSHRI